MSKLYYSYVMNSPPAADSKLGRYGQIVDVMYEGNVFVGDAPRHDRLPSEELVRKHASAAAESGSLLVSNIECWTARAAFGTLEREKEIQQNIDRHTTVLEWCKDEGATVSICGVPSCEGLAQNLYYPWSTQGMFGSGPVYEWWRYRFDRQESGALVKSRLFGLMDFVAPCYYPESRTNQNIPQDVSELQWWTMGANAQLPLWRSWGLPIVLFCSPHYYGEISVGNVDMKLAQEMTDWCTSNGVSRLWWGALGKVTEMGSDALEGVGR